MLTRPQRPRTARGFTMLELVCALLIVATLSTVAAVSYASVSDRARTRAATAQLTDIGEQVLARRALDGGGTLRRDQVVRVLDRTFPAPGNGSTWTVLEPDQVPAGAGELSVAFDGADPDADRGTRMALTARTQDGHLVAAVVDVSTPGQTATGQVSTCTGQRPAAAAQVLAASSQHASCEVAPA